MIGTGSAPTTLTTIQKPRKIVAIQHADVNWQKAARTCMLDSKNDPKSLNNGREVMQMIAFPYYQWKESFILSDYGFSIVNIHKMPNC